MEPFVFIVGCARSGTTLLQRLVGAHPQIAITPEMHWITDYFREGKWLGPEGRVTADQVASMTTQKRFRQFEFTQEAFQGLLREDQLAPYAVFHNGLFALYGQNKGKKFVGNKTPVYVKRIPRLHEIWPRAKFVHLIRDGRDVCLSVLNWNHAYRTAGRYSTWDEDPVTTTALWWKRKVLLGQQGGQTLNPDLYYEIKYEELVTHAEGQCEKLCEFLGVHYDSAMLRFHEGRTKSKPGLDAKRAWLPITPGLRDWRSQMTIFNVERFEAAAGDLLEELGYPRSFARCSAQVIEQSSRLRDKFTQELLSREDVLPKVW